MLRVASFFVVCAFAPCAHAAEPAKRPIASWVQRKVAAAQHTMHDPAARKKAIGTAALWLGSAGVGQVIDVALLAHGVPPLVSMSAGFVSSAAPTVAQYPIQKALAKSKHFGAYFDAPEHRTAWELTKDAAFSGIVGVAGGAAVSAAGSSLEVAVPLQKTLTPILRSNAGRRVGHSLVKSAVRSGQWATSQYANQKVSDASDKAREKVGSLGNRLRDFWSTKHTAPAL